MKTEEINILELIPQRPPVVMIDKLLHCDEKNATTSLTINPENIFCFNGYFTEPGLIENIAQTAAAKMGHAIINELHSTSSGQRPTIGYIAAIKNLHIHFLPPVNSQITTEINIEDEVLGFILLTGKVFSSSKIAAECELRLYMSNGKT